MRRAAAIIFGVMAAQLLSGCIIAAPIAAGAAIARSEAKRSQQDRMVAAKPEPMPDSKAGPDAPTKVDTPAAATVVQRNEALPVPDEGAVRASGDFAPLLEHVRSRATLWQEGAPIKSLALDERRTVLSPVAIDCQRRPPVVVVDLDPAAPDPDPQMIADVATGQPAFAAADGWIETLAAIRALDVQIAWVTGHGEAASGAIALLLRNGGLDPAGRDRIVAIGDAGASKQALRLGIARSACILAVVGDKRGDADEAYDYLRNPESLLPIDGNWGAGWFLLPPPLNANLPLTKEEDHDQP